MEDGTVGLFLSLVVLILLSAFFSASETAFSSVNKIRLRALVEQGNKKAKGTLALSEDYDAVLSTILIGNNLVNIASSSIGTVLFIGLFGPAGVAISTAVMTVLILVFGEVLPKSMAKDNAEKVALLVTPILSLLRKLLAPLVLLFKWLKQGASRGKSGSETPSVTEMELKYLIEDIQGEGVLEKEESELVQSALEFDEITVEEVLTPRVDMVALEKNEGIQRAKELFFSSRYSRIPVYDESVDTIIGVLNQQQFFTCLLKEAPFTIEEILQPTLHVPPKKSIADLLLELQKEKIHMAIVSDQFGGTLGLITLEDVLEELVGEIWDEHDEVVHLFEEIGENKIKVAGDTNLYDLLDALEIDSRRFQSSPSNTLNGFAMEQLGKVCEVGDSFSFPPFSMCTTVSLNKNRLPTFHITLEEKREESEE